MSNNIKDAISVHEITKTFDLTVAVNNVSFSVPKGEVVGFLGPNGSGKTTTMRMLTSFYTPDKGDIYIEGINNLTHDVEARSKIGYLPENNPLYGDMIVKEYLELIAKIRNVNKSKIQSNISRAVEETGLERVYYNQVNQCSKGYKQRVGLGAALLHEPSILIMDEPTEGLDPNQRVPIRKLIKSLSSERTVLLSTHVLQEVEETCDRILIINKGNLVANGTISELQNVSLEQKEVEVEISGNQIEKELSKIHNVTDVTKISHSGEQEKFSIKYLGEEDIRPILFELCKDKNWTLWELHQIVTRIQDMFYSLTSEQTTTTE